MSTVINEQGKLINAAKADFTAGCFNPANETNSKTRGNIMNNNKQNRVFTQVDYRQFRLHLADITTNTVKGKGFETAIYDKKGDIQAIVHAASIDNSGRCYPAEYFIRTSALPNPWILAA